MCRGSNTALAGTGTEESKRAFLSNMTLGCNQPFVCQQCLCPFTWCWCISHDLLLQGKIKREKIVTSCLKCIGKRALFLCQLLAMVIESPVSSFSGLPSEYFSALIWAFWRQRNFKQFIILSGKKEWVCSLMFWWFGFFFLFFKLILSEQWNRWFYSLPAHELRYW